ncbi:MAG: hypothetical protein ACK6CU_22010 [Deltaproteobacteria bacterium]
MPSAGQRDPHPDPPGAPALLAHELERAEVVLGTVLLHAQLRIAGQAAVGERAHLDHRGARDLDRARRVAADLQPGETLACVDQFLYISIELPT